MYVVHATSSSQSMILFLSHLITSGNRDFSKDCFLFISCQTPHEITVALARSRYKAESIALKRMRWKLDVFSVQSALIPERDAHRHRRRLVFLGNIQQNEGEIFESVFSEPPKKNDSLKKTFQAKIGNNYKTMFGF